MNVKMKVEKREPSRPDVLKELAFKITAEEATIKEHVWRACIQPKPRWMPGWLYRKGLKLLLRSEEATR